MNILLRGSTFVALSIAFLIATLMMIAAPSFAQQAPGSGLRITPTRSDLSIVPGDSREIVQTVRNVTQSPVTVEPQLNDFESDGLSGQPRLIGDPNEVSAYSLREFVSIPESFDLESGEERELTINLNVPDDATPGGYFGSIIYRAAPQDSTGGGQVALVASVGSLVLLEVPGDITEQIDIRDISAYLDDNSGSLFTKKPNFIGVEIENQGNGFSQPFGKVSVKDWRGNDVFLYELNDGSPRANILPDSTRLFKEELFNVETKTVNDEEQIDRTSPITWPGRYTVVANLSHGSTGELFTVETSFWYIPVWLLVVSAGLLVGLVGGAYYLYRKYNGKSTKRRK